MDAFFFARRRTGVVMIFVALCIACDLGTVTLPRPSSSVSPSPTPSPSPTSFAPHQIEIQYDPDRFGGPAPRDTDGAFLLDWGARRYCLWLTEIPHTPADSCREYSFRFSWESAQNSDGSVWSDSTSSRGCHKYPSGINPGPCFSSPRRHSVGWTQSVTILGRERTSSGTHSEVFRTVVPIRFRQGPYSPR